MQPSLEMHNQFWVNTAKTFFSCFMLYLVIGTQTALAQQRIAKTPVEVFSILPNRIDLALFGGLDGFSVSGNAWFDYFQKQNASGIGKHLTLRHFIATSTAKNDKSVITTRPLENPVSINGISVAVLIRIDNLHAVEDITLHVGEKNFERYYKYFGLNGYQKTSWFIDGRWALLTFPIASFHQTGGKGAPLKVESLRLFFEGKEKAGLTYHISAISLYQQKPSPGYSVMFDDGHRSSFELGLPILSGLGIPATMAMSHTEIGRKNYLSFGQLSLLHERFNWEIAAHAPGKNMPERGLKANQKFLKSALNFWNNSPFDVSGFVFAGGIFHAMSDTQNALLVDMVGKSGFLWSRSINEMFAETIPISNPMILRTVYVNDHDNPEDIIAKSMQVLNSGGWPILVFHRLVSGKVRRSTEYNIDDFTKIMRALANSGYNAVLPTEVVLQANILGSKSDFTASITKAN